MWITLISGYWHIATVNCQVQWSKETSASVTTWMGDCISMSISVDDPSNETLNQGHLALLLRRQNEFPLRIDIVQFSFFFSILCLSFADFPIAPVRYEVPSSSALTHQGRDPQDQGHAAAGGQRSRSRVPTALLRRGSHSHAFLQTWVRSIIFVDILKKN